MRTKLATLALLILFSATVRPDAIAQTPTPTPAKPTFVIVHGAWGGSWAFRRVETLLREKGCIVYRPSLTGQGERVHLANPTVGLSTHIDDVVNMIRFEDLHDVILVGHSYGGMVITGVADRIPDRIRRLIYLDAFVPNDGESVDSLTGARAAWIKPMIQGDYIVPPWVRPEQPVPKDVPQPLKTFTEPIVLKNKAALQIPAIYILTVDAGREAKSDDFASQADRARTRGWTVIELTSDHNPQWSAPEALVELLDRNKYPPRPDPNSFKQYPLGPDSSPQPGVPKGKLEGPFLFESKIIENTVRKYWVYVPAQYNSKKPACVLVFQDGQRATNPDGPLQVPAVMDNLIHKREMPVTIGIFITPGQVGKTYPDSIGRNNPDHRSIEYDSLNDTYARFIIEEMLPEVGRTYNLTNDPKGRAIGGTSSGAICAFTVAWERPDAFRKVISLIGSFTNIRGGHVYPDLVRKNKRKPIRIFIQDGSNDLRRPDNPERDWFLQNQAMVAALKEKNYDMTHVFGEGGHSDNHGGAILPDILRWLWRDYPKP